MSAPPTAARLPAGALRASVRVGGWSLRRPPSIVGPKCRAADVRGVPPLAPPADPGRDLRGRGGFGLLGRTGRGARPKGRVLRVPRPVVVVSIASACIARSAVSVASPPFPPPVPLFPRWGKRGKRPASGPAAAGRGLRLDVPSLFDNVALTYLNRTKSPPP